MGKQASNKKTVISGEYGAPSRPTRNSIGFEPSYRRERDIAHLSPVDENLDMPRSCMASTEEAALLLGVGRWYLDEREKKCYKVGLDEELLKKMDKIFTKTREKLF